MGLQQTTSEILGQPKPTLASKPAQAPSSLALQDPRLAKRALVAIFGQQDSQRQFPGSLEIKLTGDFDPPKLRQMTSLRQPPRFAAGQEASHWPANKIANPEDLSSCEQDSLTSLQQKKPPKRPTRLRLQVLFVILLIRFGKLGNARPSTSDLQRHPPRSLGSRRQR